MERTKDMMDTAARFLKSSPAVIRRSLPFEDDDEDVEHLIDGLPSQHDAEIEEINALKNFDQGEGATDGSFRSKMKKKMTSAMGKLSVGNESKREQLGSDTSPNKKSPTPAESPTEMVKKSPALARLNPFKTQTPTPLIAVTSSDDGENKYEFGQGSVNNSVEDLDDLDTDTETDRNSNNDKTERQSPDGDDVRSSLGPGQVCPRQGIDAPSNGDLKLGIVMTKGQLEVHIMCARGLPNGASGQPPDTYVKTYLTDSSKKRTQKKKTKIVKSSSEPMYRQKTKYSACNVYRREIVASVWEKSTVFDKNQCIGEVIVNLDNFDLTVMTTTWYRLYKRAIEAQGGADSDSDNLNTY